MIRLALLWSAVAADAPVQDWVLNDFNPLQLLKNFELLSERIKDTRKFYRSAVQMLH